MSTRSGISLITVGAVLRFAVSAGSPHGLNVHMVGVILILAGVLGLLLPRLAGVPRDRLRRWVRPVQPGAGGKPSTGADRSGHDRLPTLADDILREEHDPPLVEDLPGYENRPVP
jgi:hypothetical protein